MFVVDIVIIVTAVTIAAVRGVIILAAIVVDIVVISSDVSVNEIRPTCRWY